MLYFYIYITFLVLGFALSIYLVARLWTVRKTPSAYYLIWAIISVAIWSISYAFEIALENPIDKVFWLKTEYLGIPFVSLAIFAFTLVYSGRSKWLDRGRFWLFIVIPSISFFMAVTNDWHHLLWSSLQIPVTGIGPITVGQGPWYYVNVIYSYILLIIATLIFIQIATHRHNVYRAQAILC